MGAIKKDDRERKPIMTFVSKSATILGVAGAIALFTPALSNAQTAPNSPTDTWSYTVNAAPDGRCWIQTDAAFSQRGFGYWGNCPASATPAVSNEARGARAEAPALKKHAAKSRSRMVH
jgi:hypothetical protein